MKVKQGTYFWLFVAVVLVVVGAWKCYSGMGDLEVAVGAKRDAIYAWMTVFAFSIVFLVWRCYRFVEERKTAEFLAKERRKMEEIERRIRLEKAEQDRKWFEEQRARV